MLFEYGVADIKPASLSSLCQVGETWSSWAGFCAIHPLYTRCTWSLLIFDEHVWLNKEFKFTTRLFACFTVKLRVMECYRKSEALFRFPFQSSGIRVGLIPSQIWYLSVSTRGNIFRLYRPILSGFTAFRSIHRSIRGSAGRSLGRSVGRPTSLLSTEPIDHKSGIGVRVRSPSLPPLTPQFVFGFGCLKAANMIEHLSDEAGGGRREAERVSMAHWVLISASSFFVPTDGRIEHSFDCIVANWIRYGLAITAYSLSSGKIHLTFPNCSQSIFP